MVNGAKLDSTYSLNAIDYRLLHAMGMDNYYYPFGTPATEKSIQRVWDQLTNNSPGQPTTV